MRLMLNGCGPMGCGQAYGDFGAWTRDGVTARLNTLYVNAKPFDAQVMASGASEQFKAGWRAWLSELNAYMASFADGPKMFLLRHMWSVNDELDSFDGELSVWQQKFSKDQGQPMVGPTREEAAAATKKFADAKSIFGAGGNPLDSVLKAVPWLVGGAVLIYFGPPVVRGVQSLLADRANRRRT